MRRLLRRRRHQPAQPCLCQRVAGPCANRRCSSSSADLAVALAAFPVSQDHGDDGDQRRTWQHGQQRRRLARPGRCHHREGQERTYVPVLVPAPLPSYSLVRAADQVVAVLEHLKLTGSIDDQLPRAPSETTDATPSPPPSQRGVYTPPSPKPPPNLTFPTFPTMPPARSPPASPVYEKPSAPGVRFSDRGVEREREREQTRQVRPGAARTYSTLELSTIDQRWGRLFDKEGNPTQRLGQVLRGLANHIVSVYSCCID